MDPGNQEAYLYLELSAGLYSASWKRQWLNSLASFQDGKESYNLLRKTQKAVYLYNV